MNTTTTSSTAKINSSATLSAFEAAFQDTAVARGKLQAEDLVQINLEIPSAIATVIGALPRAMTLRDQIEPLFSEEAFKEIDTLETYAKALSFAHTGFIAASQPTPPLQDLFERATMLRDLLLSDATALARRGVIDGKILVGLKGGSGYLNIAYDLGAIVRVMRENWSVISQRSAVQPAELQEAEALYEQVSVAFAERKRLSEMATLAAANRIRAYTLFVKAYNQLRRAATFVRWDEADADKFVPSRYAGRGGRGNVTAKPTPVPPPPVAPTSSTDATHITHVTAPAPTDVSHNMPGGSPFTA